jgi:hypothetical protein
MPAGGGSDARASLGVVDFLVGARARLLNVTVHEEGPVS